jgi:hypothetical protein
MLVKITDDRFGGKKLALTADTTGLSEGGSFRLIAFKLPFYDAHHHEADGVRYVTGHSADGRHRITVRLSEVVALPCRPGDEAGCPRAPAAHEPDRLPRKSADSEANLIGEARRVIRLWEHGRLPLEDMRAIDELLAQQRNPGDGWKPDGDGE